MSIEWTDEERDALYDAIEETRHSEFEPMTVILDALTPFVAAREKAAERRGAAKAFRRTADELIALERVRGELSSVGILGMATSLHFTADGMEAQS